MMPQHAAKAIADHHAFELTLKQWLLAEADAARSRTESAHPTVKQPTRERLAEALLALASPNWRFCGARCRHRPNTRGATP